MSTSHLDARVLDARARQRAALRHGWASAHARAQRDAESGARNVAEPVPIGRAGALRDWWQEFWPAPWRSKKAQLKGVIRDLLLEAGAVDAAASGVPPHRRAALVARHVFEQLARRGTSSAGRTPHTAPPRISFAIAPGAAWKGPIVSVVTRSRDTAARIAAGLAQRMVAPFEVVWWDASGRVAGLARGDDEWTVAPDVRLSATLLGKYAWVAPDDLALAPNLLQLSVLALEAGRLECVFGAVGTPGEGQRAVGESRLPGPDAAQATLVVGRTEWLRDDLGWSLSDMAASANEPRVCGRVLSLAPDSALPAPAAWGRATPGGDVGFAASGPAVIVARGRPPVRLRQVLARVDEALVAAADAPLDSRNVLLLFPFLAMGGAETVTLEVLHRLAGRYRFTIVTSDPLAPSLGSTVADFLRVTPAVYPLGDAVDRPALFSCLVHLVAAHRSATVFVANGSTWIYDAAPALKARFPSLRLINQVFDHRFGWINRYDKELVATFDHHIAPNTRIARAYRDRGVDPARISVVHHGVDTRRFAPERIDLARVAALRSRLGIAPGRAVVTLAGRLHPQKRPLDFIALAQRFRPEEATFLLVGDGPLAPDIDAAVGRARLPHLVRLPFHRPVEELLAMSSVMLILSEYEGLPLVLLEAQALGTPVVGTDVGAVREALDWTGGGRVIPVGDIGEAEAAVRAVLAAPPDRVLVRERLCAGFDADVCARGYAEAFDGVARAAMENTVR